MESSAVHWKWIAFSLVLSWGCAGTRARIPLFSSKSADPNNETVADAVESSSPFKRADSNTIDKSAHHELSVAGHEQALLPQTAINSAAPQKQVHDPEIRRLIEQELADATPQTRQEFLQEFETLAPEMIRLILKTRRQVMRFGQKERLNEQLAQVNPDASAERNSLESQLPPRGFSPPRSTGFGHSRESSDAYRPGQIESGVGPSTPWDHHRQPSYQTESIQSHPAPRESYSATTAPLAAQYMQRQSQFPSNGYGDSRLAATNFQRSPSPSPTTTQLAASYPPNRETVHENPISLGNPTEIGGRWPDPNGMGRLPSQWPQNSNRTLAQAAAYDRDSADRTVARLPMLGDRDAPPLPSVGRTSPTIAHGVPRGPDTIGSAQLPPNQGIADYANRGPGVLNPAELDTATQQASPWRTELEQLIAVSEYQVGQLSPGDTEPERQHYIEQHVYLRMLYLMLGRYERALQAIPVVEPADQEFWQQTFWAIANYFDSAALPDSSDRAKETVAQLRSAVNRLQEKAGLELRHVTFSHKISSFGNYERYQRDEFNPGQQVLLYAEVENFRSEPTADGQYRTLLKSSIEIYKAGSQGGPVESIPFAAAEDLCRNPRRDYFHRYSFTIPQNITIGPHVLKLTVEDQLSRKVASYSLNFTVK